MPICILSGAYLRPSYADAECRGRMKMKPYSLNNNGDHGDADGMAVSWASQVYVPGWSVIRYAC